MQNYRRSIVEGLIREGHLVTTPPDPQADTLNSAPDIEAQLKQVANTKYQVECGQIADSPNPTDSELQKLKDKRAKTKPERWIERKGNLARRYGEDIPITPELVAKDDQGWYSKILFHYYLTVGRPYLIERDSRQLRAIAANTKNRLWLPDLNRSLLSTPLRLLETLVTSLLKPGVEYRGSDPNLQLIAELALSNQRDLKTFLGLTIVKSDTPVKIAQKLLSLLGLKLTYVGRLGSRTKRERVYIFNFPDDNRERIFESWLQRDQTFIPSALADDSETNSGNLNLLSVSTIRKSNYLSLDTDFKEKTNQKSQIHLIQEGTIVKWLMTKEQWIVKATTGIVAKISNTLGKEVILSCHELQSLEIP